MSRGFVPIRTILSLFAVVSLIGHALRGVDADLCSAHTARRPTYLRLPDGRDGLGSAGGRVTAGRAPQRSRLGRKIAISSAVFGTGLIGFGLFPLFLAVDGDDAGGRLRHDAGHGIQQHHHPDHRKRRHARPA